MQNDIYNLKLSDIKFHKNLDFFHVDERKEQICIPHDSEHT
jgi:hypothetical protein